MKLLRVVAVALALIPRAAYCELTSAEKLQAKRLLDATFDLGAGERYLATAVQSGTRSLAARDSLAAALLPAIRASNELTLATVIVLGTSPANAADAAALAAWEALSRPEQLERAWFHLNRVIGFLVDAQTKALAAQAYNVDDAVYQDALRRARTIWFENALTKSRAVDRTLAFADPYPPLCFGCTVITVVGPHGDYKAAQKKLYFATKYFRDWVSDWHTAYGTSALLDSYANVRGALVQYSNGIDAQHRAMGLLAGIAWSEEEAAEDPFCRTLRTLKLLTVTVPFRYHATQDYWRYLSAALPHQPFQASLTRLSDSWKHNDEAAWELMVFPNGSRCPTR